MAKYRFWAILILAGAVALGFFVWNSEKTDSNYKFKLGLDLSGGAHLVYKADVSKLASGEVNDAMQALRDAIERRINLFGVSEPLVQVEQSGVLGSGGEHRLIVELPGVTDINEAIKQIGATPSLEFKLLNKENIDQKATDLLNASFESTGLSGTMLKKATLQFDTQNVGNKPVIGIAFNTEGEALFAKITRENVGDVLGIFLDGKLMQAPYIREEITGGQAVISGDFSVEQAKEVIRNLYRDYRCKSR
jgi:protein-export membrane protein SecD